MLLDELRKEAAAAGWHVRPSTLSLVPIVHNGETVGFYCPHPAGGGRTRVGPIWVTPVARGRGLALQAYQAPCYFVAYVHNGNVASERLHEKAGFYRWRRTKFGMYWRRG